jgi:hypothetical protein
MKLGYDLGKLPITYDFAAWLVCAEAQRIDEGWDSLEIYFQPGEAEGFRAYTDRDFELSHSAKVWRLHNLLVPLTWTLPSVKGVHVCAEYDHDVGSQAYAFNRVLGDDLAPLRASVGAREAVRFDRYVTMTVRDSVIQPERNTNQGAYAVAEEWLRSKGYNVITIPDTEAVLRGVPSNPAGVMAALSVDYRLALYQAAEANVFTTGGPMTLAMLGSAPYLAMGLRNDAIQTCTPEYLTKAGLADGHKRGYRRQCYWAADTVHNIISLLEAQLGERAI